MPTFAPARGGFADPASRGLMLGGLAEDGIWYIDHCRHDDLTVYQTMNPEALNFVLKSRDGDTVNYEISLAATMPWSGSPVVSGPDFIHPRRTGWQLRKGPIVISSGFHSEVNIKKGDDFMSVAGVSWLGYLDLCKYPFDPLHPNDFVIGSPPQGLAYEVFNTQVSEIVSAVWNVIFGRPNRPPLVYIPEDIGLEIPYFRIDLGDTTTLLAMLQSLADFSPGFDFWIEPVTLQLKLATPNRYGTPAAAIATGGTVGSIIIYNTDDTDPDSLEFTNEGPSKTHTLGLGSGTAGQLGTALGTILGEETFWRIDGEYNAGNVFDQDYLDDATAKDLSYGLNPVHTIPVVVDPARITDFWTKFTPNKAIWIDEDLEMHQIDSPHKIIQMDGTIDKNGNDVVQLGLNQIYDTSDDAGIEEA